jgi:predicted YcjX-like family ATPase
MLDISVSRLKLYARGMDEELGRVRLNDTTEIVVRIVEYKGEKRLDIRKYVTSQRYTGWSPQGISIPLANVKEIRELIGKVE